MKSFRIVEAALWLVAVACAFWSTLWVLGGNGFDRISYDSVPRWLDPLSLYGANGQALALPSVPVHVATPPPVLPAGPQSFPDNYASIMNSQVAVLQGLTDWQQVCYVVVHLISYAAVAFIAITLARLVADSRGETPFRSVNVGRPQRIGLLLVVGSPLASLANWGCQRWLVASSSIGDRATVHEFVLSTLPLWTMLVGAAVLVLADVWRRGVRMAEDVEGLV